MTRIKFDITGDNSDVLRAFRGVQDGVSQTARIVEQQGQSIDAVFNKIKNTASVAFAGFTAKEIVTTLATIRGEFQQSEIAFETMLGSATKAKAMINDLANLAATTPFDMSGVVSGAKQLLAYGIEADKITETMRRLGDVSAGLGLNLQDIAWLYGTTMTQGRLFSRDLYQFTGRGIPLSEELAKQFGVTKDKVSELVTAGKVGFPEVQKAIWSMTSEGGEFGGLMEKQSKSITGQIANIQDTIEMAINDLGTQTEGIMNSALSITSTVVDHWQEIGAAILSAASAIGLYKAMAVGMAAWDAGTASVGYQAELLALQAILPLKEEEHRTDLEEAVAKGQLSAAQAELVASKREEAAAYVEELQAKAAAAKANAESIAEEVNSLKNRADEAQRDLDYYEQQYEAVLQTGDGIAIETAENNLNTATLERNAAARRLQVGQERLSAASTAADTAATEANTAAQQLNTAGTARDTAAKGINAQFTLLCQKAQEAWNASMFASPLFWIAAAVVGAAVAVYKLVTAETEHEKAIRKSNEAWEEFDSKIKERQSTIESLIRTVQSETASEYEKADAYQRLSNLAPQLTEKYDQATLASADFAKTQKEVAESMDKAKYDQAVAKVEELRKKVEQLSMTAQTTAGYTMGGTNTGRAYEQAKEDLAQAEKVLYNIIALRKQVEENARPIEVRLKEAQENEATRQKIFDFYDEAMALASDWQSANDTINFATGATRLDEFIAKTQKDIADLREEIKKNPADVNLRLQESEKTKVLDNLLSMKQNWETTGATTIPLIFKANWQSAQQSLNQAKTKAQALLNSGSTESYATAYTKAQREYEAAKRKVALMEKNRPKYSVTQYETATQDLKAATDAFSKLGGDVSGKSAKAQQKRNKEANKRVETQEQLNEKLKQLQQKNQDEEISLMQEGTEKKLKEIDNDYKKRIAEIDKQEKEFKKANKKAGIKTDVSGLTSAQSSALSIARKNAEKEQEKDVAKLQLEAYKSEIEAMQNYLKDYGTTQEQKYAITKEYADKIKEINKSAEYSDEEKSWRIKSLEKERDSAISKIDSQNLALDIDWSATFEGVGNVLKDIAKETLEKVETYMKTDDFKKLSATDKKSYSDLREELKKQQGETSNPFSTKTWSDISTYAKKYQDSVKALITATQNHEAAIAELKSAEDELESATTETSKSIAKAKIDTAKQNVSTTANDLANAQQDKDNSKQGLADASNEAARGLSNFSTILSNITSGSLSGFANGVAVLINTIKGSTGEVGNAFSTLFGKVGGLIGAILQIIDALGDDAKGFIQGLLGKIADLVGGILSNIPQIVGSIITGVVDIIGNVIGSIGNGFGFVKLFGGKEEWWNNSNAAKVNKKIEDLTESNERLNDSIDRLRDTMENSYGKSSTDAYKAAVAQQKVVNKQTLAAAKLQAGYHDAHHSWDYYVDDKQLTNYIKQATGKRTSIWNLTPEEMQKLLSNENAVELIVNTGEGDYGDRVYEKLKEYADLAGEIDELTDSWRESMTQVSFDSMKDSFISSLMDMESSAEDFADDFAEMMQKALLSYSMEDLINGDLKKLYEDWAQMISDKDGELTEADIESFNKRYDAIVEEGLERREQWAKVTGYTGESSSQSATSGGWQSMGQDTADELNGRFTALQIAGENISNSVLNVLAGMEALTSASMSSNGAVLEIRNMMIMTNSYLEDMVKYARNTYNDFGAKLDDIKKELKTM